jgi:hypothetical protein
VGERASDAILGVAGEYGYGLEKPKSQTIKQVQVFGKKKSHIGLWKTSDDLSF